MSIFQGSQADDTFLLGIAFFLLVAFAVGDVTKFNIEMKPNPMPPNHEMLWVYTEVA